MAEFQTAELQRKISLFKGPKITVYRAKGEAASNFLVVPGKDGEPQRLEYAHAYDHGSGKRADIPADCDVCQEITLADVTAMGGISAAAQAAVSTAATTVSGGRSLQDKLRGFNGSTLQFMLLAGETATHQVSYRPAGSDEVLSFAYSGSPYDGRGRVPRIVPGDLTISLNKAQITAMDPITRDEVTGVEAEARAGIPALA